MSAAVDSARKRVFPCSNDGIVASQAFLGECIESPRAAVIHDEIVSNIVRCSGAPSFMVAYVGDNTGGVITYSDAGKPFDPTRDIAEPDIDAPLEDRKIGGLGMFMVKKLAKSAVYRRNGDLNELAVTI